MSLTIKTKKFKPETRPLYIKGLPRQLRANWKAACAKRSVDMRKRVQEWMERDVQDEREARSFVRAQEL